MGCILHFTGKVSSCGWGSTFQGACPCDCSMGRRTGSPLLTQAHCCIPVEERFSEGGHTHALVLPQYQCNANLLDREDLGGYVKACRVAEVCNRPLTGISCIISLTKK